MLFKRPGEEKKFLQYSLVVVAADGSAHTYVIEDSPVTIGRSPNATICLAEEAVSRQHCMVTPSHGRLTLLDQGSTNGTRVNGKKVKQARLSHGDTIEIGDTYIRIQGRTANVSGFTSRKPRPVDSSSYNPNQNRLPREQVALFKRLVSKIAGSQSAETAAFAVIEVAFSIFPVDRAFIVSNEIAGLGKTGKVIAAQSREEGSIEKFELNNAVIKRVMASAKAERHLVASTKTVTDLTQKSHNLLSEPILCAPMRFGQEVIGVLYLDGHKLPEWAGSGESLSLLSALADVAALAFDSGRLERYECQEYQSSKESFFSLDELRDSVLEQLRSPSGTTEEQRAELSARLLELGDLTREQQNAVEQLRRNLEEHIQERADVIEDQRIELAARLAELEHLQRTRSIMSRGLVHDIRNLVSALTANLSYVEMELSPGSDEISSIQAANQCASRIVDMAEDVLAVSRMEEGNFPLKPERVRVVELMKEVIQRHKGQARESGIDLGFDEVNHRVEIYVDPNVISRIYDNLVNNALRFAGYGGRVLLRAKQTNQATELVVVDTGPGVAPENRDRIFDEWAQVHSSKLNRVHGLGLYFCRLAVEAHGGTIHVEGTSGNNKFVIYLPSFENIDEEYSMTEELPNKE